MAKKVKTITVSKPRKPGLITRLRQRRAARRAQRAQNLPARTTTRVQTRTIQAPVPARRRRVRQALAKVDWKMQGARAGGVAVGFVGGRKLRGYADEKMFRKEGKEPKGFGYNYGSAATETVLGVAMLWGGAKLERKNRIAGGAVEGAGAGFIADGLIAMWDRRKELKAQAEGQPAGQQQQGGQQQQQPPAQTQGLGEAVYDPNTGDYIQLNPLTGAYEPVGVSGLGDLIEELDGLGLTDEELLHLDGLGSGDEIADALAGLGDVTEAAADMGLGDLVATAADLGLRQ